MYFKVKKGKVRTAGNNGSNMRGSGTFQFPAHSETGEYVGPYPVGHCTKAISLLFKVLIVAYLSFMQMACFLSPLCVVLKWDHSRLCSKCLSNGEVEDSGPFI